jgi:2-keto-4-pentenoate hydratase/2-oxohepta-3-ene-1,7-dioic acid hydratase in catechol pathway
MDKIVCLGKNYVAHIREIGEEIPEKPVIFMKPPSALKPARSGEHLVAHLPPDPGIVNAECEIVLRLGRGGYRMDLAQSAACIDAVTVGLDMTLWEMHNELKKKRYPWAVCKAFPESAIIGPWKTLREFPSYLETAKGREMMLGPAESVCHISQFLGLEPGDLIFTGTPHGVLSIAAGQTGVLRWSDYSYSVTWKIFGT